MKVFLTVLYIHLYFQHVFYSVTDVFGVIPNMLFYKSGDVEITMVIVFSVV